MSGSSSPGDLGRADDATASANGAQRAVVYAGPGRAEVADVRLPALETRAGPGVLPRRCDHGVIVRTLATCVCGSDLHTLHGPGATPGMVLGHELTGVVVEVGRDVERVKVGDACSVPFNVACGRCANCRAGLTGHCLSANPSRPGATYGMGEGFGGWAGMQAEYALVPYADFNLYVFADADQARERLLDVAMIGDILPTGYHAARSAGVAPGSTVYIAGAGPVGLACAAACRMLGAAAIIVGDFNAERLEHVRSVGFIPADLANGSLEEIVAEVVGRPLVDVGIDCVGASDAAVAKAAAGGMVAPALALNDIIGIVRHGGSIAIPGVYPAGAPGVRPPLGVWLGGVWSKAITVTSGATPVRRYQDELAAAVLLGGVGIGDVVHATTIPLAKGAEAYEMSGAGASRKFVLTP
ncbi:alcohol dehydrogenase catalytic domain-containing protein [Actinomadura sp. WAC 06369]|uniref:alcohol dehydrogenase catalytic domain-containing protein n=1 Tax=Actinomadura sp. WAC 06369 TaxID=2203193 RepID=UPI000F767FA8|nr:alcohol dehydrogenase catalytic domain-containing protein [Actinomadura sp. WAC 06369]RSN66634.1 formaldehyde dehydrogenase, glutathione-independent [Actinomadura sp. WAC 06369]